MKYIILFLLLSAVSIHAQINPEQTYSGSIRYHAIVQVDSGQFKYVFYNGFDSVLVYNLDHTLERLIKLPTSRDSLGGITLQLVLISKKVFDLDDGYECMVANTGSFLKIFKENGDLLFGCVGCQLSTNALNTGGVDAAIGYPNAIVNTERGAKMMIDYTKSGLVLQTTVFGLPGKIPSVCAIKSETKSAVSTPSIVSGNSFPTSAYPNPSDGQMRISYSLPQGESTGELVILSTDGVEVKRYKVGYGFNDILVEKGDLASGSYFYKLVTEKGESDVKRLVILK